MQEQKEQKKELNEERTQKLAVALTVAGTLLVLFFVIILIIQFVQIGVKNARLKELQKQENELNEMISNGQEDLDRYMTEEGLYYLAIKDGWTNNSGK